MEKSNTKEVLNELLNRYPSLNPCKNEIEKAFENLNATVKNGGTIFTCGNGGSAADSEHIVGELMKSFKIKRPIDDDFAQKLATNGDVGEMLSKTLEGGIKAISLTSHLSLSTAYANDNCPKAVFAQQLYVLGGEKDSLIVISTSGNSENCVYASVVAKAKGMKIIALTGEKESELSKIADVTIKVSERETFKVQELHLPVYHALCAMLEAENFGR